MPRSTTVWAAALVLASFSGSGPLLTTAEAMPAPGPQQTQGRPKYYFPRHVKRQIVTNITAPALPTSSSSSSSSSSSEQLQSRQFPDFSSFVESLFGARPDPSSSEGVVSKSEADPATTVTSVQEVIVTESPEPPPNNRLTGTGNLREPSAPVSSSSSEDVVLPPPNVVPTGRIPDVIVSSSPIPTPSQEAPEEVPEEAPEVIVVPSSAPPSSAPASTGGFPEVIVLPSSSQVANTPVSSDIPEVIPSEIPEVLPSEIPEVVPSVTPTPSPSAEKPVGGLLSSLLGGLVGSTGGVPSSAILPTSSEPAQEVIEPSEVPRPGVSSTGGLPEVIVTPTPTPTPFLSEAPPIVESSSFLGPFIVPGSTGGLPETVLQPTSSSEGLLGGLLSSILAPLAPEPTPSPTPEPSPEPVVGSTGGLPSSVVLPTSGVASASDEPIVLPLPTSGIVVGITTALGTGDATPTPTVPAQSSEAIPTSEGTPASTDLLGPILSSLVSELPGVLPSSIDLGLTQPSASASGIIPPILSSLISDVPASALPTILSSILSGGETLPSGSAPIPISSEVPPVNPSSGVVPTPSVPTPSETASISVLPPVVTPSATPTPSDGILPSSGTIGTSASGSPIPPASVSISVSIPTSELPPSSVPSPISSGLPASVTPPVSGNATVSTPPITSSAIESASIPIPTIPSLTSKPSPVISLAPTGSDSATTLVVGTSIIQEQSTSATPSPTSSGIPASLPKMIAPPEGVPDQVPQDSFMGQVCFKWPLNYPFVAGNDAGRQIFYFLPIAIADGLNITTDEVKNFGLKPLDTTASQGFITTAALFTIPKDLQSKLTAQLRNPADALWHNKNSTVNDLTNLINTACPLQAGPDNSQPNQVVDPAATSTGGAGDGGAIGGDIGASRKINPTSAGIGAGVVAGAIAYGAAMFFVARRYRAKRMAHQRSSSVPSTSRMTYGSIPGGATAWMHGARNGRITPGSRGSRGSSSSQGRSVRTQQISAPVMAENSLGWN